MPRARGVEGLDDVVVGARLESRDPVGLVAATAEHDHRDVAEVAEALQEVEAAQVGEAHVEDHQVPRHPLERLEGARRVGSLLDPEPLPFQRPPDEETHRVVVVDDEHPRHRRPGSCLSRRCDPRRPRRSQFAVHSAVVDYAPSVGREGRALERSVTRSCERIYGGDGTEPAVRRAG